MADDLTLMTPPAAIQSGHVIVNPAPSGPSYAGIEDQVFACALDAPMAPGEARVAVSLGPPQMVGIGPIEPFDAPAWFGPESSLGNSSFHVPAAADGWSETVDGMPAKVVVVPGVDASGPDEIRTWALDDPNAFGKVWFIRFALKADLEGLRAQADTIARSLRFDVKPTPLAQDDRDILLAEAIDRIDREARAQTRGPASSVFPRTAGEQRVQLTDGPGGPLLDPVDVTCTTTIELTPLNLWHATLVGVAGMPSATERPAPGAGSCSSEPIRQ